jgi:glycosyltransferase involved in cell wall biosynthesis
MTRPWLSVVMPTYNGERYLPETFASLAAQDERGFECIVVDGGSTDGTRAIVDEYAQRLDVRFFVQPQFPNWIGKTNFGFAQASAEHVCMLHHDDLWHRGRAAAVRAALAEHPAAALVLHPSALIGAEGERLGQWSCPLAAGRAYGPEEMLQQLLVQNFISVPSPTFRVDTALATGGVDPGLWYTGDWDFYLKLAATGKTVYLGDELSSFRLHGASLTVTGSADNDDFRRQLDVVLQRHIESIADEDVRRRVRRAAEASNAVNAALAQALHGSWSAMPGAVASVVALGPWGWRRYFRNSRIVERVGARLKGRRALRAAARGER